MLKKSVAITAILLLHTAKFSKHVLPTEAQFSPVNPIICNDLDNDGFKDMLLAGNEYQMEVTTGRYDASYGCFLRGSSKKTFASVPPVQSGFILEGDVKDMSLTRVSNNEKIVLAAVNNDTLWLFRINVSVVQSIQSKSVRFIG